MNKTKRLRQVDDSEFLTCDEAAEVLGVKPTAVRNYLNLAKMTTYKFKTLTLIKVAEIERWRSKQKKK